MEYLRDHLLIPLGTSFLIRTPPQKTAIMSAPETRKQRPKLSRERILKLRQRAKELDEIHAAEAKKWAPVDAEIKALMHQPGVIGTYYRVINKNGFEDQVAVPSRAQATVDGVMRLRKALIERHGEYNWEFFVVMPEEPAKTRKVSKKSPAVDAELHDLFNQPGVFKLLKTCVKGSCEPPDNPPSRMRAQIEGALRLRKLLMQRWGDRWAEMIPNERRRQSKSSTGKHVAFADSDSDSVNDLVGAVSRGEEPTSSNVRAILALHPEYGIFASNPSFRTRWAATLIKAVRKADEAKLAEVSKKTPPANDASKKSASDKVAGSRVAKSTTKATPKSNSSKAAPKSMAKAKQAEPTTLTRQIRSNDAPPTPAAPKKPAPKKAAATKSTRTQTPATPNTPVGQRKSARISARNHVESLSATAAVTKAKKNKAGG